jgi:hypothetical protein
VLVEVALEVPRLDEGRLKSRRVERHERIADAAVLTGEGQPRLETLVLIIAAAVSLFSSSGLSGCRLRRSFDE